MKIENGWESIIPDPDTILTVGAFDGIHRGHQAIINLLSERKNKSGGTTTIVTFEPHPQVVLSNKKVTLLTTLEEKMARLSYYGLERFVVIPFDKSFASTAPETYISEILYQKVGMKELVVGYDHRFGKNREGDWELLKSLSDALGFTIAKITARKQGEEIISSTVIRELIKSGKIRQANKYLGYSYQLEGTVVQGHGRGPEIGFKTANISVNNPYKLIPAQGIYAVKVLLPNGEVKGGMLYIGNRPTFDDGNARSIEVHIFDFEGNLYGEQLKVEFWAFSRKDRRFSGSDELRRQLELDKKHCLELLKTLP